MWRPAHGATSRPGPVRPASGYGRLIGRPGPRSVGPVVGAAVDAAPGEEEPFDPWLAVVLAALSEQEAETPAPVTP